MLMRTVIFIPPLPRMSGGLAVLYQLAERLREAGLPVALCSPRDAAPGLREYAAAGGELVPWGNAGKALKLSPEDCWLTPEGWPNALAPGLEAGARCLVYVQNWAYLVSAMPAGLRWRDLPLSFLAVSHPVAWFLTEMLDLPLAGIVRPMLDAELFRPLPKPDDRVRVAWMPRKNKALAEQIMQVTDAALQRHARRPPLQWVEINRMSPQQVAAALGDSHIFLSTGFPEGFGLPPLEAMRCNCLPVGFSGFGGWDYMRSARISGYTPTLPLRPVPWAGNGFFVADGDVIEASRALEEAIRLAACKAPAFEAILAQGQNTANAYSRQEQLHAVQTVWAALADA